ncbi:MAG: prenyltransferase [bacterium]
MEGGLVRSILGTHVARRHPDAGAPGSDPNSLVEAWTLSESLAKVQAARGEQAVRQLAADYVALWARTFRTLVRHLRGRPERAISLFASEVYPYLRGDRLAARVEAHRPGEARILLQSDLPDAYLAGLVESFVGLSGAQAHAKPEGNGQFVVYYRLEGRDRLVRLAQVVAAQRLHLVLCAVLSAAVGIALAVRLAGPVVPWRIAAILLGAVAVQLGANALHDLRHPHASGPLNLKVPNRRALLWQSRLGYAVASVCGVALAIQAPVVVLFAVAGLALSTAFGHLKNIGWGPLLAGIIYGPLVAEGALHAAAPGIADHWMHLAYAAATIPTGALAAAVLYADDLADRPLDEAGGSRTLLVRLPRRRHLAGYASLVLGAIAALAGTAFILGARVPFMIAGLGIGAILLVGLVQRNLDDPRGLAPVRFGTLVLHVAVTAVLCLAILGVAS